MKEVFADTTYLVALQVPRDRLHPAAMNAASLLSDTIVVTTELVLVEFLSHFSRSGEIARRQAIGTWKDLHQNPFVTILPITSTLLSAAIALYERAADQSWSLVDCASFVIMRERKIAEALTFDHHFEQAGFQALLRTI